MTHAWHRRVFAQAGLAAGLAAVLGGCLSAPQGPTSAGAAPEPGGNVSIDAVAQRYIDGSHFMRITEYFDYQENKGGHIIERTDPKDRTGYYFIVDLDWHPGVVMPKGTKVVLDYIRGDNTTPRQAVFTFPNDQGTWSEVFLGLTGADWPSATTEMVAYKLTFETADGKVLASHQSFLWNLPDLTQNSTVVAANSTAAPVEATKSGSPAPAAAASATASVEGGNATAAPAAATGSSK
jgi:hypothetical protein